MDENGSQKKSEKSVWIVVVLLVIGVIGMLGTLGDQDGTWLIASAIAFGSLLHY